MIFLFEVSPPELLFFFSLYVPNALAKLLEGAHLNSEQFSVKLFCVWKPNLLAPYFRLFQSTLSALYSLAPLGSCSSDPLLCSALFEPYMNLSTFPVHLHLTTHWTSYRFHLLTFRDRTDRLYRNVRNYQSQKSEGLKVLLLFVPQTVTRSVCIERESNDVTLATVVASQRAILSKKEKGLLIKASCVCRENKTVARH